jgi:hypothetical protein
MNKLITLVQAVLLQIKEFTESNQSYSKYDITKAIREKCNNSELALSDCEVQFKKSDLSETNPKYRIDHEKVSEIVEWLWESEILYNGIFPQFRKFNGKFWEYHCVNIDESSDLDDLDGLGDFDENSDECGKPIDW